MAIPTFTSITPNTGHPGGQLVAEIAGTNFRTRSEAFEVPEETTGPTVQVTFSGVSAGSAWTSKAKVVEAESSTLLRVEVPAFLGNPNVTGILDSDVSQISFPAASITIENLDDDGEVIAGESVTEADAFTYVQPLNVLPADEPPIQSVIREFIHILKRQILGRVTTNTHTDYGAEGEAIAMLSEHPSIDVVITVNDDDEYKYHDNEEFLVDQGTHWDEYDNPMTVRIDAQVFMTSEYENTMYRMLDGWFEMCMRTPWVRLPIDIRNEQAKNYPGSNNLYPFEVLQQPQQIGRPSRVNIQAYSAQISIRAITMVSDDPIARIYPRTTIELTTTDMDVSQTQTLEVPDE